MILLINICREKFHYFEFVKPIEDILKKNKIKFLKKHYTKIKAKNLKNIHKIIICGTSLKDNNFLKNLNYFKWISGSKKPILGICGGMQIIGLIFELKKQNKKLNIKDKFNYILKNKIEIGFYKEKFKEDFFGLKGEQEVYHLHNFYVDFFKLNNFKIYTDSPIAQAVKHKKKFIYGVLFHPEVRQKDLIKNFCLL